MPPIHSWGNSSSNFFSILAYSDQQFRQPRKRKWQTYWTERLFSRQRTNGEMMSLEEDTRIGNVEEQEILGPRKAILQTQIDVEKVSRGS